MRISKRKYIFTKKDLWNLDNTFNPILTAGLVAFKDAFANSSGVPSSLLIELYPNTDIATYCSDEMLEKAKSEFIKRIDLMIFAFSSSPPTFKSLDITYHLLSPLSLEDHLKYQTAYSEYTTKVNTGLTYFAKHYHDLWC